MKTTLEKAKEQSHDNLVDNLQGLLQKNYEAEKGFTKAMENAEDTRLKHFFKNQAAQRARFANELTNEIRNLNEEPVESGGATAALHRAWMDVKNTFSANDDEAMLEESIRGDKASVNAYEKTLEENNFPPHISSVISRQADDIRETLSTVRRLEDIEDKS